MLRPEAKRDLLAVTIVAFIVAAALLSIARYRALLADAFDPRTIGENLLANGRAVPEMLSLWFRPWALSADHAFSEHGHFGASIAGLGLLLALVAVAFVYRRRVPMLMLAIAWPLIVLLPTNSILSKPDLVTEKPLYLAWVGVAIAMGAGLAALLSVAASRGARRIVISAVGLVLCALIGASVWRAALWRDPVALWTDAVAKAPYKSRCWNNLGMANLVQQREQEAVVAFERAVFLDPANEYAALNLFTARALCGSKCPGP